MARSEELSSFFGLYAQGKSCITHKRQESCGVLSTALVAKEEKEAPYDFEYSTNRSQILDESSTTTLRKGYAARLTMQHDGGILFKGLLQMTERAR